MADAPASPTPPDAPPSPPPPAPAPAPATPAPAVPTPRRSWRRRLGRWSLIAAIVGVVLLFAAIGAFLFLCSDYGMRHVTLPTLANALDIYISADYARVTPLNGLRSSNLHLAAKLAGENARLEVDVAGTDVDWSQVRFRTRTAQIVVNNPRLRLSAWPVTPDEPSKPPRRLSAEQLKHVPELDLKLVNVTIELPPIATGADSTFRIPVIQIPELHAHYKDAAVTLKGNTTVDVDTGDPMLLPWRNSTLTLEVLAKLVGEEPQLSGTVDFVSRYRSPLLAELDNVGLGVTFSSTGTEQGQVTVKLRNGVGPLLQLTADLKADAARKTVALQFRNEPLVLHSRTQPVIVRIAGGTATTHSSWEPATQRFASRGTLNLPAISVARTAAPTEFLPPLGVKGNWDATGTVLAGKTQPAWQANFEITEGGTKLVNIASSFGQETGDGKLVAVDLPETTLQRFDPYLSPLGIKLPPGRLAATVTATPEGEGPRQVVTVDARFSELAGLPGVPPELHLAGQVQAQALVTPGVEATLAAFKLDGRAHGSGPVIQLAAELQKAITLPLTGKLPETAALGLRLRGELAPRLLTVLRHQPPVTPEPPSLLFAGHAAVDYRTAGIAARVALTATQSDLPVLDLAVAADVSPQGEPRQAELQRCSVQFRPALLQAFAPTLGLPLNGRASLTGKLTAKSADVAGGFEYSVAAEVRGLTGLPGPAADFVAEGGFTSAGDLSGDFQQVTLRTLAPFATAQVKDQPATLATLNTSLQAPITVDLRHASQPPPAAGLAWRVTAPAALLRRYRAPPALADVELKGVLNFRDDPAAKTRHAETTVTGVLGKTEIIQARVQATLDAAWRPLLATLRDGRLLCPPEVVAVLPPGTPRWQQATLTAEARQDQPGAPYRFTYELAVTDAGPLRGAPVELLASLTVAAAGAVKDERFLTMDKFDVGVTAYERAARDQALAVTVGLRTPLAADLLAPQPEAQDVAAKLAIGVRCPGPLLKRLDPAHPWGDAPLAVALEVDAEQRARALAARFTARGDYAGTPLFALTGDAARPAGKEPPLTVNVTELTLPYRADFLRVVLPANVAAPVWATLRLGGNARVAKDRVAVAGKVAAIGLKQLPGAPAWLSADLDLSAAANCPPTFEEVRLTAFTLAARLPQPDRPEAATVKVSLKREMLARLKPTPELPLQPDAEWQVSAALPHTFTARFLPLAPATMPAGAATLDTRLLVRRANPRDADADVTADLVCGGVTVVSTKGRLTLKDGQPAVVLEGVLRPQADVLAFAPPPPWPWPVWERLDWRAAVTPGADAKELVLRASWELPSVSKLPNLPDWLRAGSSGEVEAALPTVGTRAELRQMLIRAWAGDTAAPRQGTVELRLLQPVATDLSKPGELPAGFNARVRLTTQARGALLARLGNLPLEKAEDFSLGMDLGLRRTEQDVRGELNGEGASGGKRLFAARAVAVLGPDYRPQSIQLDEFELLSVRALAQAFLPKQPLPDWTKVTAAGKLLLAGPQPGGELVANLTDLREVPGLPPAWRYDGEFKVKADSGGARVLQVRVLHGGLSVRPAAGQAVAATAAFDLAEPLAWHLDLPWDQQPALRAALAVQAQATDVNLLLSKRVLDSPLPAGLTADLQLARAGDRLTVTWRLAVKDAAREFVQGRGTAQTGLRGEFEVLDVASLRVLPPAALAAVAQRFLPPELAGATWESVELQARVIPGGAPGVFAVTTQGKLHEFAGPQQVPDYLKFRVQWDVEVVGGATGPLTFKKLKAAVQGVQAADGAALASVGVELPAGAPLVLVLGQGVPWPTTKLLVSADVQPALLARLAPQAPARYREAAATVQGDVALSRPDARHADATLRFRQGEWGTELQAATVLSDQLQPQRVRLTVTGNGPPPALLPPTAPTFKDYRVQLEVQQLAATAPAQKFDLAITARLAELAGGPLAWAPGVVEVEAKGNVGLEPGAVALTDWPVTLKWDGQELLRLRATIGQRAGQETVRVQQGRFELARLLKLVPPQMQLPTRRLVGGVLLADIEARRQGQEWSATFDGRFQQLAFARADTGQAAGAPFDWAVRLDAAGQGERPKTLNVHSEGPGLRNLLDAQVRWDLAAATLPLVPELVKVDGEDVDVTPLWAALLDEPPRVVTATAPPPATAKFSDAQLAALKAKAEEPVFLDRPPAWLSQLDALKPLRSRADVALRSLTCSTLKVTDVQLHGDARDGVLTLTQAGLAQGAGRAQLSAALNLTPGQASYRFNGKADKLPLGPFADLALPAHRGEVQGELNGKLDLAGAGPGIWDAWLASAGSGDLKLLKVRSFGVPQLKSIATQLDLKDLDVLAFDEVTSDLTVKRRRAIIEEFQAKRKDIEAAFAATIRLDGYVVVEMITISFSPEYWKRVPDQRIKLATGIYNFDEDEYGYRSVVVPVKLSGQYPNIKPHISALDALLNLGPSSLMGTVINLFP